MNPTHVLSLASLLVSYPAQALWQPVHQTAINTVRAPIAGKLNLLQSGVVIFPNGARLMRKTALVLIAFMAMASFCAPALAAAKIYKWTDANGQVHFDSSPPPGQLTEKVRIRKGVDAPAIAPATTASKPDADSAKNAGKPVLTPQQRAELTTYCSGMRERIGVLKQGGNVVEKNPDGSSVALNAATIAEKVKGDEANVKTYCTANGL